VRAFVCCYTTNIIPVVAQQKANPTVDDLPTVAYGENNSGNHQLIQHLIKSAVGL
jgi:hypothetical protein